MANLIVGNDGANALLGTTGQDVIYGFNPEGPQGNVTSIAATRVASGLTEPLFVTSPPDDLNRLFIVEKRGQIKILDLESGTTLATPFLNVGSEISIAGERGLLGLTFDPGFAENGYFYVNLINTAGDTEIRRYQVSAANPNQADPASETLIIQIDEPDATNHKAGWLGFGPDGYLYAALGDGGPANDPNSNAQNINALLRKILRLDVSADGFPADPNRNYAIPPTIRLWASTAPTRSMRSACATRGARASIARSVISTSPTWGKANGKRSISARLAQTMDGSASKATNCAFRTYLQARR